MIRVHILYEYGVDHRPHGSAHIRLLLPLQHPSLAGRLTVTSGESLAPADVVIVDRTWKYDVSLHTAEKLLKAVRAQSSRLVYSIDDNLLDLDLSGGFRAGFTMEQLAVIRLLIRESDAVLVSTAPLADRLRPLNPNIHLLPNALDERLFPARPTPDSRRPTPDGLLKVGYMGTFTHDDDLYMILEALRSCAGRIELQLAGGIADARALEAFAPLKVNVLNPHGHHEYPDFTAWMVRSLDWDLGIAPLEDTVFTRCKSDIKFLDYSLLGIPGIYSKVPAYRDTVKHGETGWLAENSTDAWREALHTLIDDADQRQRLAVNAEDWVRENRTLEHCARLWTEAIEAK